MFGEFKAFIARGNVLDLAVGVIIGAAFGKIVTALTDDILMPLIGTVFGGMDFTNKFIMLGAIPGDYKGSLSDYAALKAAGVPLLGYGSFATALINFVIMAFVIFLIIRQANKVLAAPAPAPAGPSEVDLLTEIRDLLKKS
ncbi:MAG TPA: large conductance mechanosensitive channel protein MscL [Novosphingobium sp.]|nr:large conductance mechanosensitive channel protein MscL [Novosphingobium sp.]